MSTINERLSGLATRRVGPVDFQLKDGRLFARVLHRTVALDVDADMVRSTAATRLPGERPADVDDQEIAAALANAVGDVGGLPDLSLDGDLINATLWVTEHSTTTEIAIAARETARLCSYAEGVVERLYAGSRIRAELADLEASVGSPGDPTPPAAGRPGSEPPPPRGTQPPPPNPSQPPPPNWHDQRG